MTTMPDAMTKEEFGFFTKVNSKGQRGSITDMAVEGTKVPENAGVQNTIPSVPRPGQITNSAFIKRSQRTWRY